MSPSKFIQHTSKAGFPRVSGDEPIEAIADQAYTLFSPRERG